MVRCARRRIDCRAMSSPLRHGNVSGWHDACRGTPHGGGGPPQESGESSGRDSELGGTAGEPVEGTSPSHWTTHRPLRPPSLDQFRAIHPERVGARRRAVEFTRSLHPRREGSSRSGFCLSGFRAPVRTLGRGRWGMSRRSRRRRPVSLFVHEGVAWGSQLCRARTGPTPPARPDAGSPADVALYGNDLPRPPASFRHPFGVAWPLPYHGASRSGSGSGDTPSGGKPCASSSPR